MNKTIILCVSIATSGLVLIFGLCCGCHYYCKYMIKKMEVEIEIQTVKKTETRDRKTVCMDTIMTKSIEAKKPIDAKVAKEICG